MERGATDVQVKSMACHPIAKLFRLSAWLRSIWEFDLTRPERLEPLFSNDGGDFVDYAHAIGTMA
jgi:hypothetical protein